MAQPARLTSNLLVRKGEAFPTGGFAYPAINFSQPLPQAPISTQQRCGTPLAPDETIIARLPERPAAKTGPTAARPSSGTDPTPEQVAERVAVTLRLDRERYTKLKIFAARRDRTGQDVMLKALDAYLEACGADCACVRNKLAKCGDRS